ncbi:MAG TPA: ABC transporter ATP-binding protein [Candidatus Binatia bacterium]|jgi:NitT/TauT family transport system ATP-binding protein
MNKLEARGICKSYKKDGLATQVLRDINLTIEPGEFVSIVGASGCGKTTFLRIVDGLIQPDSGAIVIDDHIVVDPGQDRGFVFQADCLLPWRTVIDNVALGLELQGRERRTARDHARRYVRLVGLQGFEDAHPAELSGGMRQRANLARALVINPEVLLMDEPFAALDAQTREIMQRELLRIWGEERKTVLFVTHQIEEAVYLSDCVVVFTARPGRVKQVVPIEIDRPRPFEIKQSAEFNAYVRQIWKLIEEEVLTSMGMQAKSPENPGTLPDSDMVRSPAKP